MSVKYYNKLVRDQIPASLIAKKLKFETRIILNNDEFTQLLKQKLLEEAHEVQAAGGRDEVLKELADVLEVVQTICDSSGITLADLEAARVAKSQTRGGFSDRQFLVWAEDDR